MKTKALLALLIAMFVFLTHRAAIAGCTLAEVIKMAKEGAGKRVIEDQCDSEVDDMPRCNFKRIVTLALNRRSVSTISDECGLCDRPKCELVNGGSCWLGASAPRGIKEGDTCYCNSQIGPIYGETSCNN